MIKDEQDFCLKNPDLALEDNRRCFVCGADNPYGINLRFRPKGASGVEAEFLADSRYQGFSGILHGGIIAMLLDEAMVNAACLKRLNAVSAEINVRLKIPVRIGQIIRLEATILEERKRVIRTGASACFLSGQVCATATGVCVRIR